MKKIKKGSTLVAVLLVMFMIAIIAISIISRTNRLLHVSIESKKSQQGYQTADQNAERIFNQLKKYDDDVAATSLKGNELLNSITIQDLMVSLINSCNAANPTLDPAACNVYNLWNADPLVSKLAFYDGTSATPLAINDPIQSILKLNINSSGTSALVRAVSAPVPPRIGNPTGYSIVQCSGANPCDDMVDGASVVDINKNRCNFEISFDYPDVSRASGFVFKINRNDGGGWAVDSELSENLPQATNKILKNGEYGWNGVYFSLKAKNKNNYEFDSTDTILNATALSTAATKSPSTGGICYGGPTPPPNTKLCDLENVCCNSECYMCKNVGDVWRDDAIPALGCRASGDLYGWDITACVPSACGGNCGAGVPTADCKKLDIDGKPTGSKVDDSLCINTTKPDYCFDETCQWEPDIYTGGTCYQDTTYSCQKGNSGALADSCCLSSTRPSPIYDKFICGAFVWDTNSCSVDCVYPGISGKYLICLGYPNSDKTQAPIAVTPSYCSSLPNSCSCQGVNCNQTCDGIGGACLLDSSNKPVCKYPDGADCSESTTCASGNCCMGKCIDDELKCAGDGCGGVGAPYCYNDWARFPDGSLPFTMGCYSNICRINNTGQCNPYSGPLTSYCGYCQDNAYCGNYCREKKPWSIPSFDGVTNSTCECSSQCTENDSGTRCCSGGTTIGANAGGGSGRCRKITGGDENNCGSCGCGSSTLPKNDSYWECISNPSTTCQNSNFVCQLFTSIGDGSACECNNNCRALETGDRICSNNHCCPAGQTWCSTTNSCVNFNANTTCGTNCSNLVNCTSISAQCKNGVCLKNNGQDCSADSQCYNNACCAGIYSGSLGSKCASSLAGCMYDGGACTSYYDLNYCNGLLAQGCNYEGGWCAIANGSPCTAVGYWWECQEYNCTGSSPHCCASGQYYCSGACRNESNTYCGGCNDCTPYNAVCSSSSCVCPSNMVWNQSAFKCLLKTGELCGANQYCNSGVCSWWVCT